MPNHVLLLRHGEAEPYSGIDASRCLTERGIAAVKQAAKLIYQQGPLPDAVISSSYVRARQTAEVVCQQFTGVKPTIVNCLVPAGDVSEVTSWLNSLDTQTVLLASHQPLVQDLMASWLGDNSVPPMATSNMAYLYFEHAIAPGFAELQWFKTVDDY